MPSFISKDGEQTFAPSINNSFESSKRKDLRIHIYAFGRRSN